MDSWRGVRFGTSAESVRSIAEAWPSPARVEVTASAMDSSMTIHGHEAEGGWRAGLSLDDQDFLYGHIGVYWPEPLGIARSTEVIDERLAAYGPPDEVVLGVGTRSRHADIGLVWSGPTMRAQLSLFCDESPGAGELPSTATKTTWTVHESYTPMFRVPPRPAIAWSVARATLDEGRAFSRWAAESLRALDIVAARHHVNALIDDGAIAALRARIEHRTALGVAADEVRGAFVVWKGKQDPFRHHLWRLAQSHRWWTTELTSPSNFQQHRVALPEISEHVVLVEGEGAFAILSSTLPNLTRSEDDARALELSPFDPEATSPEAIEELGPVEEILHPRPPIPKTRSKALLTQSRIHPITLRHLETGLSVHVDLGKSVEEIAPRARALLLARVRRSRRAR